MNSFICIIYNLDYALVMMNFDSHGAYVVFVNEFYNSYTSELFNKWNSNLDIGHFAWFSFVMS